MEAPRIAVVSENILECYGLKYLLENIIPFAETDVFTSLDESLDRNAKLHYFHFFIDIHIWVVHSRRMASMGKSVILFGPGDMQRVAATDMHFILTDVAPDILSRSLLYLQQSAHHHYSLYPQDLSATLRKEDERTAALLTNREKEILKMVALGKSSKEIAAAFHISMNTVNTHRKNIMDKLDAHSATKITAYAMNHGYITLDEQ